MVVNLPTHTHYYVGMYKSIHQCSYIVVPIQCAKGSQTGNNNYKRVHAVSLIFLIDQHYRCADFNWI